MQSRLKSYLVHFSAVCFRMRPLEGFTSTVPGGPCTRGDGVEWRAEGWPGIQLSAFQRLQSQRQKCFKKRFYKGLCPAEQHAMTQQHCCTVSKSLRSCCRVQSQTMTSHEQAAKCSLYPFKHASASCTCSHKMQQDMQHQERQLAALVTYLNRVYTALMAHPSR